jgi:hypothetical protein
MIWIGIDTGVKTGLAVWCSSQKQFISITTEKIHRAMEIVKGYHQMHEVTVCIEDARKKVWYGSEQAKRAMGAGSVRRDAKIWEDFCKDYKIPFLLIAPKSNRTKLSEQSFKAITKHQERASEHARDAAMLVFQK